MSRRAGSAEDLVETTPSKNVSWVSNPLLKLVRVLNVNYDFGFYDFWKKKKKIKHLEKKKTYRIGIRVHSSHLSSSRVHWTLIPSRKQASVFLCPTLEFSNFTTYQLFNILFYDIPPARLWSSHGYLSKGFCTWQWIVNRPSMVRLSQSSSSDDLWFVRYIIRVSLKIIKYFVIEHFTLFDAILLLIRKLYEHRFGSSGKFNNIIRHCENSQIFIKLKR